MTTPELVQFVKSEIVAGVSKELISDKLKTQGWSDFDIIEVFGIVSQATIIPPSQAVPIPQIQKASETPMSFSQHTQPLQPVYPVNEFFVQPKKSKKILKFIIIPVIVIILLGAGALAYASGYLTSLENVFSQSVQSSQSNTTGTTFNVHFTADTSGLKSKNAAALIPGMSEILNFDMNGSYDVLDKDNIKSISSFMLTSGKFELGLDSRMIDGSIYLKLTKAPDLGFFSLKPFEDKWVTFPYKTKTGELTENPLFSSLGVNADPLNNITDEQKQHIADLTKNANFVNITNKHLPEIINKSISFHFDFDLDRQGTITYLKDLMAYIKSIDKSNADLSAFDEIDFDKGFNAIKNFKGEVWIGILDHRLNKFVINVDVINPDKLDDGVVRLTLNSNYSDWNKPAVVEVPVGSVTIEELISGVFGGAETISGENSSVINKNDQSLSKSRDAGMDAEKKNDIANLRAQAELYWTMSSNQSYKGFCTSKSSEGAYVYAVKLPPNSVYKCNDSKDKWASWVKLSANEFFCADSSGFTGTGVATSIGLSCPFTI